MKVALVTGSTSNIGKAIAEALARDGFHVVVTSRHEADARAVAEAIGGSSFALDFADAAAITRLFAFVVERFGRLDALVNSVAYTKNESILDCDLDTWQRTIDTNLRSYFLCTKHAAGLMKTSGGGAIVNITVSSTRGAKDKFSYMVSKGGINYLTMCAAIDLAPFGIRVNAVGSGLVGTAVGHRDFANRPFDNVRVPLGHIGEPADVAEAVAFLVSDRAKYTVGARLAVDGGLDVSL
ncbi:MAG TPA: SDR family oxidoreductase [Kofleriaceae bacterium]|jgi:NAD(P)-dependent dehydrogenase (short-subunit alcohol dehydrogenase family)